MVLWEQGPLAFSSLVAPTDNLRTGVNWDGDEPRDPNRRFGGTAQQRIGGADGLHDGGCCCLELRAGACIRAAVKVSLEVELWHPTSIGFLGKGHTSLFISDDLPRNTHRFIQSGRVA